MTDYNQKYLKYKEKYLNLKKLNGSAELTVYRYKIKNDPYNEYTLTLKEMKELCEYKESSNDSFAIQICNLIKNNNNKIPELDYILANKLKEIRQNISNRQEFLLRTQFENKQKALLGELEENRNLNNQYIQGREEIMKQRLKQYDAERVSIQHLPEQERKRIADEKKQKMLDTEQSEQNEQENRKKLIEQLEGQILNANQNEILRRENITK
jgi:hypothetical protein